LAPEKSKLMGFAMWPRLDALSRRVCQGGDAGGGLWYVCQREKGGGRGAERGGFPAVAQARGPVAEKGGREGEGEKTSLDISFEIAAVLY
jgi:hypothetical protein